MYLWMQVYSQKILESWTDARPGAALVQSQRFASRSAETRNFGIKLPA